MLTSAARVCLSLCFIATVTYAWAEIGVPGAPGGFYFSMEGGYQQSNAPGVAAQGASTVVPGAPGLTGSASSVASANSGQATAFSVINAPPPIGLGADAALSSGLTPVVGTSVNGPVTIPSIVGSGAMGIGPSAEAAATSSIGTQLATASPDGGSFIDADQGGYSNFTIGYVLPTPFGILSRIEVYGAGSFADANENVLGAFGLRSVDNKSAIAFSAEPINNVTGGIYQSVGTWEVGVRLKADEHVGPFAVALSAEPFYINYLQDTTSTGNLPVVADWGGASANRTSNVGANLYGGQLAAEAVVPLFGKLSLIGRGSAGLYNIDADANFSSLFSFDVPPLAIPIPVYQSFLHDEENRLGARLGGQAGLRYAFSSSVWLSFIGTVDYLSEVPTAILPREVTDPAAHIGFTGELDWRVGMRLTLAAF